jgi:ADP-ribosyl-[dinitrogen reductase] hydrolase
MLEIISSRDSLLLPAEQRLSNLRQELASIGADRRLVGSPDGYTLGTELCDASVLAPLIYKLALPEDVAETLDEACVAPAIAAAWAKEIVSELVNMDARMDRAAGALVGLAIGDGVGAPLEFLAVDASPLPATENKHQAEDQRTSFLSAELSADGELVYRGERNKFRLRRGQWTDDTSMALCLAYSLLVRGHYHGGDCRIRYFDWWHYGYNSAFRFDPQGLRRSVGLGTNIASSLEELLDFEGADADTVPWVFESASHDAGNGSMMRLAPVAIRYAAEPVTAVAIAEEQSLATHPGENASVCCQFLAFAIAAAISRPSEPGVPMPVFLDEVIIRFIAEVASAPRWKHNASMKRLLGVLLGQPQGPAEACWRWRDTVLPLESTLLARGPTYNGYPVKATYFGAYSMDALCMALWALNGAATFSDSILRVVNLLGDADTTGAICGQLAGAFYGYKGIGATALGERMHLNLLNADPLSEIPLRALLLCEDGRKKA